MAGRLLIRDAILALPSGPARSDLLCEGHRIVAMGRALEAQDADLFDARGLTLGPGFVDIHVHGGGGYSFFSKDPANVRAYAAWAPRNGVTAFLVSTVGRMPEETEEIFCGLREAIGSAAGAEALGFHLEGPFINPDRKGAFHADMLRVPSRAEMWGYQEAADGFIRQVTFAPELPGALSLAAAIVVSGAVAAIGHTDATVVQTRRGFDAGARHVTHLYNAMRPMHQREGGPGVAALLEEAVTCELICDGTHVAPEVLQAAFRLLGPQRAVVVTDNLYMAGTGAGRGRFGGQDVEVSGATAVREDGTIVGSLATMDQHFRNAMAFLGIDLATAFRLCSTNPARVAGVAERKGALQRGMDADLVLLDTAREVVATVACGQLVWNREPERLAAVP